MTLDKFLTIHNATPKEWWIANTSKNIILLFTTANKTYTLLPEYFARHFVACGLSINHIVKCLKSISKDFDIDCDRLIKLTLNHCISLI